VPGWLIPGLYFDYLRSGNAAPLGDVFEHNRHDLLSLAALTARLARQYADPFQPDLEDPHDLCALGGAFEGVGLGDRAALCYERALALAQDGDLQGRVMLRLGSLYKRLRLRQDALEVWRRLAGSGRAYTGIAYVELAKHYEHVAREYREAEAVTLRALDALELRSIRGETWQSRGERAELEHRLARLRRKMAGSPRSQGARPKKPPEIRNLAG
jgi:tetratricopeptide (TPR) repeat protein